MSSITDAAGNVRPVNGFTAYGIPNAANLGWFQHCEHRQSAGQFARRAAQIILPELGFYYYKARIYSPYIGRFLQIDPIGYKDQWNLYTYVGNDPVNQIDPTGKDAILITNADGSRTLLIPVNYTGSGANPTAIANMANGITVVGSTNKVEVVVATAPINGVHNQMDVSPGYDHTTYPMAGEGQVAGHGPEETGGNVAHINSSNLGATEAAAHDTLYFAGITDQYDKGPRDANGN